MKKIKINERKKRKEKGEMKKIVSNLYDGTQKNRRPSFVRKWKDEVVLNCGVDEVEEVCNWFLGEVKECVVRVNLKAGPGK